MEKRATSTDGVTSPASTIETIDPAEESKLLAKLDLFFVPVIMAVYLSCFLDRSNIGNVKVAGMPEDINATTEEISTAVSIFYATYVLVEAPWAIALKKITPRLLMTGLCVVWSLTTIFSGFITNIGGLYAARLVLGACEGGLFPGLNLYLTMVYKRAEQARRVSYLFVCTALSGAFGGLLAYLILKMDGVGGYAGWRWVYIIEGLFSMVVAVMVWFGLPNDPSNAYFLNEREKELMRIRADQRAQYMGSEEFSWEEVLITLRDPKLWLRYVLTIAHSSVFVISMMDSSWLTFSQWRYPVLPRHPPLRLQHLPAIHHPVHGLRLPPSSVLHHTRLHRRWWQLPRPLLFLRPPYPALPFPRIGQLYRHHRLRPHPSTCLQRRQVLRNFPVRCGRLQRTRRQLDLAQRQRCAALPPCGCDWISTDDWKLCRHCGGADLSQGAVHAGQCV